MKKLVVILLSTLLFFNSSLFIILYSGLIFEATQEAKEKVFCANICSPSDNFKIIKHKKGEENSSSAFSNLENDEIVYNGFLYDVIYRDTTGDTVNIYCYEDAKEDQLVRILITHVKNEDTETAAGGLPMQYFNILFSFLSNALVPQVTEDFPVMTSTPVSNIEAAKLSRGIREIPVPPPRQIV
jgi:hypothetical protein